MSTFPQSFPAENTYRLVHYSDPATGGDADRVLELAADAITEARRGVLALDDAPADFDAPVDVVIRSLTTLVRERNVHTEVFRELVSQFAGAARYWLSQHDDDGELNRVLSHFERALELSERVADIQAAQDVVHRRPKLHRKTAR